jgi:hypothetical protein
VRSNRRSSGRLAVSECTRNAPDLQNVDGSTRVHISAVYRKLPFIFFARPRKNESPVLSPPRITGSLSRGGLEPRGPSSQPFIQNLIRAVAVRCKFENFYRTKACTSLYEWCVYLDRASVSKRSRRYKNDSRRPGAPPVKSFASEYTSGVSGNERTKRIGASRVFASGTAVATIVGRIRTTFFKITVKLHTRLRTTGHVCRKYFQKGLLWTELNYHRRLRTINKTQ